MIATAIENKNTAWLGEFPSHWEVLRIKNLFTEMDSRSETGSEELLSVSHYTGVTLKRESLESEDDHLTNAESLVGYKLVQNGDLVINIMLAWNGSLGISPYNGITSPAYCVYRIKGDNNPEYFGYLFTTNLFKAEFRRHSTGIIDSRLRLYSDKFFAIFSVVPPKDEQDEIVQYIKAQEDKINLFIQKKLRFIELLKEQRQSVIDLAITRGTNRNTKLVDSGEKWIGKIPHSWQLRKLKFCVSLNSNEIQENEIDEEVFKIALENIDNWTGKFIDTGNPQFEGKGVPFKAGDVLFNKLRPYLAKAFIAKSSGFCVGELLVLTPNAEYFTSEFLFQRLMTSEFIDIVNSSTYGAKMPRASWNFIGNLKIPIPPIEEQKQIVSHIKTETATIDKAIAKAEREIELMKEYKEAMIAEAVIGVTK
ncbi:MAG: restriction endonuclease subunit S [Bacteroidia bacterium]|nr:restriction endonuclease subunit S [Bacteroidia bacterium]